MAVIKGGSGNGGIATDLPTTVAPAAAARPRPNVVNAEVFNATQEANRIKEEALRQRDSILADAERQKQELMEKWRDEGRQRGLAEMTGEIARAKIQAGEIVKGAEREIVGLALKIAEKVLGTDLERDPALVANIAATAIENLRNARAMTVRVNPKDAGTLRANMPKLMELIGRTVDVSIKEDSEIESFGCVIQTEFGTIDAQLTTQFAMLKDVLISENAKKEGPA